MIKITNQKTGRILEELQHHSRTAKELFEAWFPYTPGTYKVTKRLLGYMEAPRKMSYKELRRLEQKRFYSMLAKLRADDIIKKRSTIGKQLQLTAGGLQKLLRKYKRQERHIDLPKKHYPKTKANDKILIIFDIPESFKHYRNWIRYQLKLLGFTMLQKSVFIGTYQLPADFIHDLRESNILQYIHIFKVTKAGSLY